MIKEVIQGKIDLLREFINRSRFPSYQDISLTISSLNYKLNKAKSIEDIKLEEYQRGFTDAMEQYKKIMLENMEKAFEAGGDLMDDRGLDVVYQYKTFEDYLKRNEIK